MKAKSGTKGKGAERTLVVDIGGTHIKLMISARRRRKIDSGDHFGPRDLAPALREATRDWKYDRVALGFPAAIRGGRILREPTHLAAGWIGFNFTRALGLPVRVINDASLQALGSYHGGRMLFLGLGTGLGSALLWDQTILPLELGHLPYPGADRLEARLGVEAFSARPRKEWEAEVHAVVRQLKIATIADYVVLGGGLSKALKRLPEGVERGDNRRAYLGGVRLWQARPDGTPKWRLL